MSAPSPVPCRMVSKYPYAQPVGTSVPAHTGWSSAVGRWLWRFVVPKRRMTLTMVFLALTAALVACGRAPAPPAELEYSAEATSATSVRVVFSTAVDDASEVAANYAITHAGGPVQVFSAQRTADGRTVLLATARLQDGVSYTLDVSGVGTAQGGTLGPSASSFGGTSVNAPIVASAISLSSTEVLVHFADPPPGAGAEMSDMALDVRYYDIVEDAPTLDETSDLTIVSIRFAVDDRGRTDRTRIILTTEAQTDTGYVLRVTNVLTQAGDKVLDPTNATAAFRGIPVDDATPPTVSGATAISNTEVLVDFSEPVVGADNADRYTIEAADSSPLEVITATYANRPYDTQVLLTTAPQRDELTVYTVTVTGVSDRQGNAIDPNDNSATFNGVFRTGPIDGDVTPPRVANTGSTGNTTVLVTFTEPIEEASAENAAHYRITARLDGATGPEAMLVVLGATRSADRTTVALNTMAQSDLFYTLEVTNVTDLAGNQIAPPELFNDPSTVTFQGTPPSGPQTDTDDDGLSDVVEQAGWFVTVRNADGTTRRYQVTSDPGDPALDFDDPVNVAAGDTDGDGLGDLDERIYATDPRATDTDGDGIDDWTELNVYYSEPSQQDTDGDGLVDGLETNFFGTSPLQADTDGDQIDDGDEVGLQNRNPLIADLPTFDLRVVGDVQLGLDVRFTAQSTTGSRVLETRSSQSTLSTESSRTSGSENAKATEWFINAGIKAGLEYEPPVSFKFTGEVSVDGGYKEATTTSFSSSSVQATQQAQVASLGTERELQDGETVTREVVGASMAVALELVSLGDVAFTVENLVITAKLVDPRDPTSFIPIATLTSSASAINLGPAPDARGPIRFTADNPPPGLIEALRENPRNLLFEVANYDIVAEGGRNFTYTYQDVNDRTATFTFDYGGRRAAELYRVATPGTFDANGDPVGPDLFELLENVLDLEYLDETADADLIADCITSTLPSDCSSAERLQLVNSYSTRVDATTGDVAIHRIRTVAANDTGFRWFVEVELPITSQVPTDVRNAPISSGRSVRFLYGQDIDGDGLTVQVEAFYGSVDAPTDVLNNACFGKPLETNCSTPDGIPDSVDTDRDGIPDDEEIFGDASFGGYDPWLVVVRGEDAVPTSSSPARFDTDGDGLTDCQELGRCTVYVYVYPNDASANPGATQGSLRTELDADPQSGRVVGLYRDATGRPGVVPGVAAAWLLDLSSGTEALTDPSRFDSDRDGLGDAAELVGVRYLPLNAQVGDLPLQLYPGYGSGRFSSLADTATDPLNADSDFDLLGDGAEVQIGIDPTDPDATGDAALDTDGDGLRNIEERFGWVVVLRDDAGDWRDANGALLFQNTAGRLLAPNGAAIPLDDLGNPVSTVDVRLAAFPAADAATLPARVPSDPDRADADNDGLTDGQERARFSHPGRFDTDGDGLGDGAETRGVAFPSDPVDPVRFTNPLAFDSDADGRSDGEEVLVSWVVSVRGETPYRVFSDPLIADEDLDGLGDGAERSNGTDPDDADTDGDGVQDGTELGSSYGRNPLVADQVVEFRYANATILDSCYQIGGEANLDGWGIATNGWYADLRYSTFGGNPDGYLWLRAGNFLGITLTNFLVLTAPATTFAGDRSAYYGGSFAFDLREFLRDGDQTRFTPNVLLTGGGLTLEYGVPRHESTTWTTVSVPLTVDGGGWVKFGTTDAPTEAEFRAVLAGLTAIQIRGSYEAPQRFFDFLYGGVGFDNPTLAATGLTTITNDFDDGALAAGNFRGMLNLEVPVSDGSLSVVEGVVNLRDDLSGISSGATVALTGMGVQTFVLGRDQSFRAFSNNILEESEDYTLGLNPAAIADYGSLSTRYQYPVVGGSDSVTLRGELPDAASGTCELSISWTWRTVE